MRIAFRNFEGFGHTYYPAPLLYMFYASRKNTLHMLSTKITVQTTVAAPVAWAWLYFTQPQHIIHRNFASPNWHCPKADCSLQPGGTFSYHMADKDRSFNFEGTYREVIPEEKLFIP